MSIRTKATILLSAITLVVSACAQQKKGVVKGDHKKKEAPATLVTGTKQTTLPGRPGTPPSIDHHIILIWNSEEAPKTFFWHGEKNYFPCRVSKVSGFDITQLTNEKNVFAQAYTAKEISLDNVKKNDTLELYPVSGGKYPIPEDLPNDKINTVFYKTNSSNWLTLPVNKMIERPDIIMQ